MKPIPMIILIAIGPQAVESLVIVNASLINWTKELFRLIKELNK